MWSELKSSFRSDQVFNVLAIGLLVECFFLAFLVLMEQLKTSDVIEFMQKPVGGVLLMLGAIVSSRVISSAVGLVMGPFQVPAWKKESIGVQKIYRFGLYLAQLSGLFYRKIFFHTPSISTERKDAIDSVFFQDNDEFSKWAAKKLSETYGLDVEKVRDNELAKDNIVWLLYFRNLSFFSKSVRDDIEGFDLSANFQARLAIVFHLGFWLSVVLCFSDKTFWPLGMATIYVIATKYVCSGVSHALHAKHKLTIIKFLASSGEIKGMSRNG